MQKSGVMSSFSWIACCCVLFAVVQIAKSAPANSTAFFDAYYCDTIPTNGKANWTATSTLQLFNILELKSGYNTQAEPVYCHNFNFNIPRDAVISALTMQHSRYYTTQYSANQPMQDVTGNFIVNNTESNDFFNSAAWPKNTPEVFNTACCNLWGFTEVQASEINEPSFGVKMLFTSQGGAYTTTYNLYVSNMSITVFYDDCEGTSRCPNMYPDTPYCINGGCNNCTADLSFCAAVNSSLPYCNPMTGMCEVQPPMSPPVSTPEASNAPQNGNQPSTQQQPSSAPQNNDSPVNQPLSPTRAPARRISDASKMMSSAILAALIGGLFMLV